MLGNSQSTAHHVQPRFYGASPASRETLLDRERAVSMADEGGVSGAVFDAREQAAESITAREIASFKSTRTRWLAWALAAAGALILVRMSLVRLYRS